MAQLTFERGLEAVNRAVANGTHIGFQFSLEQLQQMFKATKKGTESLIANLTSQLPKIPPNTAEHLLTTLVLAGAVRPWSGPKGTFGKKEMTEFVSQDQKSHYEISRQALREITAFIAANQACQALKQFPRQCIKTTRKSGAKKVELLSIEPVIHMRDTEAVMDSYRDEIIAEINQMQGTAQQQTVAGPSQPQLQPQQPQQPQQVNAPQNPPQQMFHGNPQTQQFQQPAQQQASAPTVAQPQQQMQFNAQPVNLTPANQVAQNAQGPGPGTPPQGPPQPQEMTPEDYIEQLAQGNVI